MCTIRERTKRPPPSMNYELCQPPVVNFLEHTLNYRFAAHTELRWAIVLKMLSSSKVIETLRQCYRKKY